MSVKSPAFQWYANDFLGSGKVAAMSLEEVGAYSLLLSYDWNETGLPDDLAPFTRWLRTTPAKAQKLWDAVKGNFEVKDGRWYNPRLEKERAKQQAWRTKSAEGGKAGAMARWGDGDRGGHKVVINGSSPLDNIPSPTPTSVTTTTGYPPDFELLWNTYPRKAGSNKKQTYRLYCGHLKAGIDFDTMHGGALRYSSYATAKGWIGTEYIKAAQVFFGRDQHFLLEWQSSDLPLTKEQRQEKQFRQRGYI